MQAFAACVTGAGIQMSGEAGSPWQVMLEIAPGAVQLNQPFEAHIRVCADAERLPDLVRLDATMPAHNHGMNYEPRMTQLEGQQYKVENLVFHMPGTWRVEVTTLSDGAPHRFTHNIKIK